MLLSLKKGIFLFQQTFFVFTVAFFFSLILLFEKFPIKQANKQNRTWLLVTCLIFYFRSLYTFDIDKECQSV